MKILLKLAYGEYPVTAQFAKYSNDRTALIFNDDKGGSIDGSVNIPQAQLPNNDYIVVKNYSENQGMAEQLVIAELIHEIPFSYVPSGFIVAPIYKLTDKAIKIRDRHFKEHNL